MTAHANDHVQIVMGDFNTAPESDEIRWLCGLTTLDGRRVAYQDAWARAHRGQAAIGATGVTWARANANIDWMRWLAPERRLDYVFVTQVRRDRRGAVHDARVVFDKPGVAPTARACSRRTTSAWWPRCRWWRSRSMHRPDRGATFFWPT